MPGHLPETHCLDYYCCCVVTFEMPMSLPNCFCYSGFPHFIWILDEFYQFIKRMGKKSPQDLGRNYIECIDWFEKYCRHSSSIFRFVNWEGLSIYLKVSNLGDSRCSSVGRMLDCLAWISPEFDAQDYINMVMVVHTCNFYLREIGSSLATEWVWSYPELHETLSQNVSQSFVCFVLFILLVMFYSFNVHTMCVFHYRFFVLQPFWAHVGVKVDPLRFYVSKFHLYLLYLLYLCLVFFSSLPWVTYFI